MSAVVCFTSPKEDGNTFLTFESTDRDVYVLKCRSSKDYHNYRHGSKSDLTLEWKQKSTKLVRVCVHYESGDLSLKLDKNILVSNATSASINFRSDNDDKVIVYIIPCVPLKVPTNSDSPSLETTRKWPITEKKLEQLSTDMNHLLESASFSDVVMTDGSKEIPAHKNILSARSSVFAKMLLHPMKESKENRITIEDTSMEILRELLHFMYSGTVNIEDWEVARELYVAADKYDVQDLRGICSSILKSVDMENVLQTLVLADLYNDKVLKEAALNFIFKNYSHLKTEAKWSTFMEEHQTLAIEMLSFMMDKK